MLTVGTLMDWSLDFRRSRLGRRSTDVPLNMLKESTRFIVAVKNSSITWNAKTIEKKMQPFEKDFRDLDTDSER